MKTIATLVGCAIGDALGNPFEMKSSLNPNLVNWDGKFKAGGTFWKGEAGQWTDDTKMTTYLAKSLITHKGFDGAAVAQNYLEWLNSGDHRGIGGTTAQALNNLKLGLSWKESGLTGSKIGGNGTVMRASPIGLAYRHNLLRVMEVAMQDAMITHNSLEPQLGSVALALSIAMLANGANKDEMLEQLNQAITSSVVKDKIDLVIRSLKDGTEAALSLTKIGSSGYAPETFGAALYSFMKTSSFRDCVIMAIKCGGDCDTTAAVAGAMAGTFYGLEGIDKEYKDGVEDFNMLHNLTIDLLNISSNITIS